MLQSFAIINSNSVTNIRKKEQHSFPRAGGKGLKAVWSFPENSSKFGKSVPIKDINGFSPIIEKVERS